MITFYILSKRFSRKRKGLSDVRLVSITKKIWFCSIFFVNCLCFITNHSEKCMGKFFFFALFCLFLCLFVCFNLFLFIFLVFYFCSFFHCFICFSSFQKNAKKCPDFGKNALDVAIYGHLCFKEKKTRNLSLGSLTFLGCR